MAPASARPQAGLLLLSALLLLHCYHGHLHAGDTLEGHRSGLQGLRSARTAAAASRRLRSADFDDDAHWLSLLQPAPKSGLGGWMEAHQRLAAEAAAARESGGLDLIVYGDSIMEAFRGESLGMHAGQMYAGNRAAWDKAMAGKRARVFAISGDQAVHLLWRLAEGEGPAGLNPKVITLMICTNDLAHLSHLYPDSAARVGHIISLAVQQVVAELRKQAPQAKLVVFGLLPLQPMMLGTAQRRFDEAVAAANKEIEAFVEGQAAAGLNFKDCGPQFLKADGSLDFELMPDGVHPAGPGGKVLLQCMLQEVAPLLE